MDNELDFAQERAEPAPGARPAPAEPEGSGPGAQGPRGEAAERAAGEPEFFAIKYMGEEIPVTREELIRLAQKGRDYDRIRSRAEKLAQRVRELERASGLVSEGGEKGAGGKAGPARRVFTDPAEAADESLRPKADAGEGRLPEAEGGKALSPAVAAGGDLLEGAEAGEGGEDAEIRPGGETAGAVSGDLGPAAEAEAARRREEIDAFLKVYGPVDPGEIPEAVWREVSRGVPLLAAYQAYENRLLRAALEAERRMRSNALRAVGSGATAGGYMAGDAIEDDWYRGD